MFKSCLLGINSNKLKGDKIGEGNSHALSRDYSVCGTRTMKAV